MPKILLCLSLSVLLLSACAPAINTNKTFVNNNPEMSIRTVVTPGQWLMSDRLSAAYFDIPFKDLNRFPHRKRKLKLIHVNAPFDWKITLDDADLHRQILEESGSNSTFVDYLDLTFKVEVPSRFEGLAIVEAELVYGDGPRRKVLLFLASHDRYLETNDLPIS